MLLRNFYLFLIILIFKSCSDNNSKDKVTIDNLGIKIENAFLKAELEDDTKSLIPVLFFLDQNNTVLKDTCLISKVYHLRAVKNRTLNNDQDFLINAKKAVSISNGCDENVIKAVSNNLLGIFYHLKQDNLSSINYYKKAIFYGEKEEDKSFIVDSYINLSKIYIQEKKWDEVIICANRGVSIIENIDAKKNRLRSFYTLLAEAYMNKGEFNLAEINLSKSIKVINELKKEDILINTTKSYREIYSVYAELNRKQNKLNLAYNYMKASDSLSIVLNEENSDRIGRFLELENNLENELLLSKEGLILRQRIIIVGGVLFLIISFLFAYNRYKYSNQLRTLVKEKENLNSELKQNLLKLKETHDTLISKNEEINSLLKFNKQSLLTKTLKISNYKDAVNNIIKKVNKLIENNTTIKTSKLFTINRALEQIISEEDIWEEFKIQFEKNRPDFFEKLLEKSPKLSINEQKHCAYVAVNLKSKEVANIINLSARSVETTRYRIKKKLELENETLQGYLSKL
ncbi:hypothetical protein [Polaribacter sargassicola]|uniref:hypothetical protein n=1 Tax=Polaribacter sargassicola TaxID=2836891 RepID=UPI001F41F75C|nr:hypothetical protein [Polaribacter sp. DS7-9]MCG1036331.1 hypothetical protein [Polaribacter sp. DS7-9]